MTRGSKARTYKHKIQLGTFFIRKMFMTDGVI